MPSPRRKPRHLESVEQRLFIKRCRLDPRTREWPIFAIPNGGKRGKREAAILKAEGVLAGVPDIFVPAIRGIRPRGGLFLEFKTTVGRQSLAQKTVRQQLLCLGYDVRIVRSAEEAWAAVSEYLGFEP